MQQLRSQKSKNKMKYSKNEKSKRTRKKNYTLDLQGRTPPFKSLTCCSRLLCFSAVIQAALLRAFCSRLDTSFHLTSQSRTLFPAPILLPRPVVSSHVGVFVCPRFVGLPSVHSLDRLHHTSFCQLLTLVVCCAYLPMEHLGLFQEHPFYVFWANHFHAHLYLLLKK